MAEPPHLFFRRKVIEDFLGSYVYALLDPRSDKNNVFYVGKAGGREGQGNTRPDGHLFETAEALAAGRTLSRKQQTIADLWKEGREPVLAIVRRRLNPENVTSEDVAFEVEAALIEVLQRFCGAADGNKVSGHHEWDRGLLIGEEIEARVAALFVNPSLPIDDVWVFNISRAIGHQRNPDNERLYGAVRGDWAIGMPVRSSIAVGLVRGIARVVCSVDRWFETADDSGRRRRKRFDGTILDEKDEIGRELLHKDFTPVISACRAWLFGQPLRVNFDGKGGATPTYNGPSGASIDLAEKPE